MNESYAPDTSHGASPLKSQAAQVAEDLRSQVAGRTREFRDRASETAQQLREAAEEGWLETQVRARELLDEGEAFVRENPGKSVAMALGVGFILGLLFRR